MKQNIHRQTGFAHLGLLVLVLLVLGVITVAAGRVNNKSPSPVVPSNDINSTQSNTKIASFTFAAAGDFSSKANAGLVLSKIGESKTDFTLALGDLGYDGNGTEQAWCDFVKQRVGDKHPFEIVAGNHDDGTSEGNILEYRKCLPDRLGIVKGDYGLEYYFDYKDLARFILISPDIDDLGFTYTKGSLHYDWLASAIDGARKSGIKWVVLGMHKNCISVGTKTCEIGEDLLNLALEKKIDLILQGHEHAYIRSKQLSLSPGCPAISINIVKASCIVGGGNSYIKDTGSIIVISGAGGIDLRDINLKDSEIGYFEAWNGSNTGMSHGFGKFTVSDESLKGAFIAVNGSFTDTFSINLR